ncbi:DUF3800 domain-containing protein [Pseudomonas avellanae]|uniref:DUF3800 domain-containing protein n=1 Tax=Pseudomonas avellanae TaxID=46257 RepID=A0A3M5U7I0_9PSED|nr:DUF3800 domain-containing protein [Pseudomonas avellanae]EKG33935.1 hypothetical protein Pav631_0486 [Pseudomonas avellanae BPIC 631]RMU41879.1 hypothetical protein ALP32_01640 [Pseudomonas avellanae]UQW68065.1 DUF3800 domain-containing protein [Pseudomonas avellanae]GGJ47636.1 hypothetical protein GCM10009085_46520 [Pseudomonas avellanae]
MDRTYAFVDESGNSDLDTSKGGSSGFFIVCSILVAEKDLEAAYAQAEALRMRHFQAGEIKSSNLKPKDSDRRARILNELAELPFKLYFTVVDKSRIHKDGGLRIKTSFIKYVNGLLYERLFRAYPDLQMIVDEHGGQEFQESLKSYVAERFVDDLFGDKDAFQTMASKDNVLVQVADFFAGSVAQIYEEKASEEAVLAYKKILRSLTLGMLEWPSKYQSLLPPPTDESGYADYQVHQEALRQADRFSERAGEHPDEDERLQLGILRFLRFQSEFVTKDYVLTTEIMAHLKDSGLGEVNGQRIRSSGIAKLRDADVIITSAAKGYKIPQTRADINEFLERASGIVVPLLERVKKAREVYRLSSRGEYDIVTAANLAELAKLIAALEAFADE